MKAMILAAGRGKRMGALTDHCPKPLLTVAGLPLIEYHVRALASAGFKQLVINVAYRPEAIIAALGDGDRFGVSISYSHERNGALETGGGIAHALPLLGNSPFAVVNSDIWTDYPYAHLPSLLGTEDAHLVLVPNPSHHPNGDFSLAEDGLLTARRQYTFSGIGIYRPAIFTARNGAYALAPLLHQLIDEHKIRGSCFAGRWWDVGTPSRLQEVERFLLNGNSKPD